jgi:hypothetical protein
MKVRAEIKDFFRKSGNEDIVTPQSFNPNSEIERQLRKRHNFVIETCYLQTLIIGSKIKLKGNPIHLSTTNYP